MIFRISGGVSGLKKQIKKFSNSTDRMKLNEYEVKVDAATQQPVLELTISIPIQLIDEADTLDQQRLVEKLGAEMASVLDDLKHRIMS